ncbi:carbohydrate ABC transporter permease [Cellulomonas marina]|uniref:Raffinose/stachyose/melibiose transport system permease protein n=1 Tax=Cellulomonas marina TaxID=988821 RepID=A0A1I0WPA5_9CELL|nr:sugar ABC transporter permease [Cellulomonas marina]GIG27792.1 sugar ABC transporter permease [Cellulomonas marina]SFA90605.1 raffinose/stachyose/melibiose transport system permease protein [Cellulomonas marina]
MTAVDERPAAPAPGAPAGGSGGSASRGTARAFAWMVVPAAVLFALFHTVPVLQGIFFSFTDSPGYGTWDFVGLRNYLALFTDPRVGHAYLFTAQFAVVATVLTNVIALAIAVGLNARIRFRTTLRAVYFLPNVLAILVVGYVFQYLFTFSIPAIATALGVDALGESILADATWAWVAIVVLAVWQGTAFNIIIYLAGLQTVPGELYEAASLDGAGAWRRFRSITFPMILGFFTINMVLSLKGFLQVFDHIIAMTGGGPGTSTESVGVLIYRGGFQGGEYGYQLANAVLFMVVIVAFAVFQIRVLQSREETA